MNKRYYTRLFCTAIVSTALLTGCVVYQDPATSSYTDNYTNGYDYNNSYSSDSPPPVEFYNSPELVVIPETYVYAVPDATVDIFFYDGWWWRPWNGRWYQSRHYKSGWRHHRGVPNFYRTIPGNWRSEYRNRRWRGHEWNHKRIPYKHVERNWRQWENKKHWEREHHWGVKDFKPNRRHDQPDRRFSPDRNHNNTRPDRFEPRRDNNIRHDRIEPRRDNNQNRPDRFEPRRDNNIRHDRIEPRRDNNRPDRFNPNNDKRNRPDRIEPRNDNRNRPDRFKPRPDNNVQKDRVMPERENPNRRERQDRRHRDDAVQPPQSPRHEQRKIEDAREQILENKRRYDEQLEINKDSP